MLEEEVRVCLGLLGAASFAALKRGHVVPAPVVGDPDVLRALVYEGRELDEALGSGEVKFEGDRSVVERFLTIFPLPGPAAPAAGT